MAKLTQSERDQGCAALVEAQATFVALPRAPSPPVDRKAFNRLHRAVDELSESLLAFRPAFSANAVRLMALLQGEQGGQAQTGAANGDRLFELEEFLVVLRRAAAHEKKGAGGQADQAAQRWVWTAADAWFRRTGNKPSHSDTGEFWQALDQLQQDEALRHAAVPIVSQDVVRLALAIWRQVRNL